MSIPNQALVLVATFNKEMTDRPLADIEDLLAGEAAPPA